MHVRRRIGAISAREQLPLRYVLPINDSFISGSAGHSGPCRRLRRSSGKGKCAPGFLRIPTCGHPSLKQSLPLRYMVSAPWPPARKRQRAPSMTRPLSVAGLVFRRNRREWNLDVFPQFRSVPGGPTFALVLPVSGPTGSLAQSSSSW